MSAGEPAQTVPAEVVEAEESLEPPPAAARVIKKVRAMYEYAPQV